MKSRRAWDAEEHSGFFTETKSVQKLQATPQRSAGSQEE